MRQKLLFSERLEQVRENLLYVARLLERAQVTPKPEVAEGWIDGQAVMNALHISERTLQNLRDNGTLGYTTLGRKIYYRIGEIDRLLNNNYVMYKLTARGQQDDGSAGGEGKGGEE